MLSVQIQSNVLHRAFIVLSFERFPNKTPLNRANNLDFALILRQWFVDSERLKILLRLAIGSFDMYIG